MSVYHYSRVSLDEQTVENQRIAAENSDYKIDYWFYDSGVSGGVFALERKYFKLMSEQMVAGDCLLVSSVDRIGRNTADVIKTIEHFQARGIKVCVLAYGNMDLTSEIGMAMISIAAVFAQLERADLQRRTRAGMRRVKDEGVKLGPPLKITPDTLECAAADVKSGLSLAQICEKYKLAKNTLQTNLTKWGNRLQDYREEYNARLNQYAARQV